MYPSEARLRNMTYAMSIHFDIEIDVKIKTGNFENKVYDVEFNDTIKLEKIYLGRFPIMLQSNFCLLNGLNSLVRYNMGECKNDPGGYFIIDGKEKVIISQEKFANNMLYIRDKVNDLYSHSAEIRCVSEDSSKPIRTLAVRIVAPTSKLSNNQIVVNVPNVKKPVPLFILMRALGITSDMANTNYTGQLSSGDHSGADDNFSRQYIYSLNTGNVSALVAAVSSGSLYDATYFGFTIHGDLA